MSWRSVVISQPAKLTFSHQALQILQNQGLDKQVPKILIPLEDISVLLIDHPQISMTAQLLAALAESKVVMLTVNSSHLPNGMLLPYLPHSRTLKVMQAQLKLTAPVKKRLWQTIVQQKIFNQAAVLLRNQRKEAGQRLLILAEKVRSGDPENREAQAAQLYFPALFGKSFFRHQNRFYNAILNYGYAVLRAALARTVCAYGFLPAFGLFHHNELNSFNLVDDLLEPYRPLVDAYVYSSYPEEPKSLTEDGKDQVKPQDKVNMVQLLQHDIQLNQHLGERAARTLLAGIEATVISLSKIVRKKQSSQNEPQSALVLPHMAASVK